MEQDTIYVQLGRKIGYWFAKNRHALFRNLIITILYRLPGGRWLSRFF